MNKPTLALLLVLPLVALAPTSSAVFGLVNAGAAEGTANVGYWSASANRWHTCTVPLAIQFTDRQGAAFEMTQHFGSGSGTTTSGCAFGVAIDRVNILSDAMPTIPGVFTQDEVKRSPGVYEIRSTSPVDDEWIAHFHTTLRLVDGGIEFDQVYFDTHLDQDDGVQILKWEARGTLAGAHAN